MTRVIPERKAREMRKALRELTALVARVIDAVDEEMKKPSDPDRGRRIAGIMNVLEMQNDRVRHFVLDQKLTIREPR